MIRRMIKATKISSSGRLALIIEGLGCAVLAYAAYATGLAFLWFCAAFAGAAFFFILGFEVAVSWWKPIADDCLALSRELLDKLGDQVRRRVG